MAEALECEQHAIESVRQAVAERERREAMERVKSRPDHGSTQR
jgi:hypothetical protein